MRKMQVPNQQHSSPRIDFSKLTPNQIEVIVDIGLRHKNGVKHQDYLKHWLYIARHFAFATKDDSWGEFEKLFAIIISKLASAELEIKAIRENTWRPESKTNGGQKPVAG